MANDNLTAEEIVIELRTNFEQVLKGDLVAYDNFILKVGALSRSNEKIFTNMAKTVSSNMKQMFGGTSKQIAQSLMESRKLMLNVVNQAGGISKLYEKTFDNLRKIQADFRGDIQKTQKAISALRNAEKRSGSEKSKQLISKRAAELEKKWNRLQKSLGMKQRHILSQFQRDVAELAAMSSKNIVSTAQTQVNSVRRTVEDTSKQLGILKNRMKMMDDLGKIYKYDAHYKQMAKQHGIMQKTLRNQSKLTHEAEKRMLLARTMLIQAADEKAKRSAEEHYATAKLNLSKVRKAYKDLEKQAFEYGQAVDKAENEVKDMANTLQKSINKGIRPSDFNRKMNKAMDLLVQYAQSTGKNMHKALIKNVASSDALERSLKDDIQALQKMRMEAEALQKTGFVDARNEINRIKKIEATYKDFINKYKAEQRRIHSTLGKRTPKMELQTGSVDLGRMRKMYNELSEEVKRFGRIQANNVVEASEKIKKLSALWEQFYKKRRQVANKSKAIQEEINKAEVTMAQLTNKKLKAEMSKYIKFLKAKLHGVKSVLNATFEPPSTLRKTESKIASTVKRVQDSIGKSYLKNNAYIVKGFTDIESRYDALINKTVKLSKKRFVSKKAINEARQGFKNIKDDAQAYEKQIRDVQNAIRKLERLQRRGLGGAGIGAQVEKLRDYVAMMRSYTQQLNVMSTQARRNMERLNARSLKGIMSAGMEMIRNFRWQLAAFIYLASRAAMGVKAAFIDVLNEVQEFRKQAMSIAANVVYQMTGNINKSFQDAYQFSRALMVKLEFMAAKTILTLEDMVMLTKTFAQAGIIPRTDKDVQRIATIGTAIKALTEGMANAGVQMRQELYAIIAGRQRATDQLAMMFKMMGVNINNVIKQAKEEGKTMIEALSDALEPFNEMNQMLVGEFATIVNKLKVIWGIIKRIAGEPILEVIAKQLDEVANAFFDLDNKILTPLGEKAVVAIRTGLTFMFQMSKIAIQISVTMAKMFNQMLNSFDLAGNSLGLWKTSFEESQSELHGLIRLMRGFMWAATFVERSFANTYTIINSIYQTVRFVVEGVKTLAEALSALMFLDMKGVKAANAHMSHLTTSMTDAHKRVLSMLDDEKKAFKEQRELIDDIVDGILNIENSIKDIGLTFKMPYVNETVVGLEKIKEEIRSIQLGAATGINKIDLEMKFKIQDWDDIKRKVERNIEYINQFFIAVEEGWTDVSEKKRQAYMDMLAAQKSMLAQLLYLEQEAIRERNRKTADWLAKERKAQAQALRQAETFLIELEGRPETAVDKTNKWYRVMEERLAELSKTNKNVANNLALYENMLQHGFRRRQQQDVVKYVQEYERFVETLTSHRVLNTFEKIDNELMKIKRSIQASVNLTTEHKLELYNVADAIAEERKQLQAVEMQYRNQLKTLDLLADKARYLQDSFSPSDQMKGEILALQTNADKAFLTIAKEMREIDMKWKDEHGNWKEGSKLAQKYEQQLVQSSRNIYQALERDLWRKSHPLWNDMIEMSKNWSDGLADSLTDLVLDFENFGESIKSLWESIVRDMLKASIKRSIIEPLMSGLGSGEPGSSNILRNIFGGKKDTGKGIAQGAAAMLGNAKEQMSIMDQFLSSGKPIPVYVVSAEEVMQELYGGMADTTRAITESGQSTTEAVSSGFQTNATKLTSILTALQFSNSSKSGGGFFSSMMGLFGGNDLSGGMNIGAPTHVGAGGTTAFGMADGGTISEHIVGKGLSSGKIYEFGERSKYGEWEDVVPRKNMPMRGGASSIQLSMPVNINALDTQTGVQWLTKNHKVIETNMMRNIKNNKAIRALIHQSR